MRLFREAAERRFLDALCEHLRRHHTAATEVYTDDLFRQMVTRGVARARARGLTAENCIAFYVALMFEIAPNFDEHPRLGQILRDGGAPPDEQIERLTEWATDEDWNEARLSYDAAAWGLEAEGAER